MNLYSTPPKYEDPSLFFNNIQSHFFHSESEDVRYCNTEQSMHNELFENFSLSQDCLTPPRTPDLAISEESPHCCNVDHFTNSFLNNALASPSVERIETNYHIPLQFRTMPEFPDLKEACNELFESSSTGDSCNQQELTFSKIRTDCMWSGVGHKPHATSRPFSANLPNRNVVTPVPGCVNPRSVFDWRSSDIVTTSSPRRRKLVDSSETPSDSEEEIDVVTVEKSASSHVSGEQRNLRECHFSAVHAENGVGQQFTLLTTGFHPQQTDKKTLEKPQTNMTLVVNETNDGSSAKKINYHLKRVPIVTSSNTKVVAAKGKPSCPQNATNSVVKLMRLTSAPAVQVKTMQQVRSCNSVIPTTAKRRVLSLDGVSMVTDTGINRYRNDGSSEVKSGSADTNTFIQIKAAKGDKKKTTRKYTKRTIAPPITHYETPTNSPQNSNGDIQHSHLSKKDSPSSSEEDCNIRAAHNVLERQRREGLRTLFNTLRLTIPEIMDNERAPKVAILKKARDHVMTLREEATHLQTEKNACEQQKHTLQQRLQRLNCEISSINSFSYAANTPHIKTEIFSTLNH